jgi:poly-gamma-glutamate capsule biosynthesis protein CapA/YwtB (metallophosphatase superfamily)
VEFARAMVDAGADLVLGHGPHVLRPMELYRERLIAYSLGNFATYYGISVTGIRGIAAILMVRVDDDGKFLAGHLEPTIQLRPAGPSIDPARQAIEELQWRTEQSFPWGPLSITNDGVLVPLNRK